MILFTMVNFGCSYNRIGKSIDMQRDRVRELTDQMRSTLLNVNRDFYADCLSKGVSVPLLKMDEAGYYTISYHCAGTASASVQQNKLRKKYPELDTKVVAVVDMDWKAEIRAKRKEENTDD